ncbi:peptidase inhibitor family I36 protein [Amycolatopsis sp. NPDC001319]|uniref:peptidase inhibitor family I36 protein n=1 Tax=unclassified Amycolatopsis TaxID=2618356 RepID=UPI0036851D41
MVASGEHGAELSGEKSSRARILTRSAHTGRGTGQGTDCARHGICEVGEFCVYHGYDLSGSLSDFTTSIPNYGSSQPGCDEFKSRGVDQYQCVKNNALSVYNQPNHVVKIFYKQQLWGHLRDLPVR